MMIPLVSVCIPVYNGGNCIGNTLNSVLGQTIDNIEVIIVDDNSTDNTESIVKSFNDTRIKYIKNEKNIGMVANWNKARSYAAGKYIKLLCMDDLISEDCLELQAAALEDNPTAVLVTSNTNIIGEDGKLHFVRKNFKKEGLYNGYSVGRDSLIKAKNLFGEPSVVMFRKDLSFLIGQYDSNFWYVPDWDHSLRLLKHGDLYYIDKALASFRLSTTSQTSKIINKNKQKLFEEDNLFLNKFKNQYNLNRFNLIEHYTRNIIRTMAKAFYLKYVMKYINLRKEYNESSSIKQTIN